jgi:putative heme-binding domain-containing protein
MLEKLAAASALPEARVHALYALQGLAALTAEAVQHGLADEHARVREHAARLAEGLLSESPALSAKLLSLADDPDARVRYQLAFTLGEVQSAGAAGAMAKLLKKDAADRWTRLAALSSLAEGRGAVLADLAADSGFRATAEGRDVIAEIARQVGAAGRQDEVAGALRAMEQLPPDQSDVASVVLSALNDGLAQGGSQLRDRLAAGGRAEALLSELLSAARQAAADEARPAAERAEAARTLGLGSFAEVRPVLAPLLDGRQPQEVQIAAVDALDRFADDAHDVGPLLVGAWPGFTPRLRQRAADAIFSRPHRAAAFLRAVEAGKVPASDLDPGRLRLLQQSEDESVRELATRLAAGRERRSRQEVLDAYRPALSIKGDADKGKLFFQKTCAACHKLGGVGHEVGPNLASMKNRGAEAVLVNLIDPNREVNPQFADYVVVTRDGRTLTGMLAAETATGVTLKRAEGATDTVLRADIKRMRGTGLSVMPEDLEKQLDVQGMADLIAYVMSAD